MLAVTRFRRVLPATLLLGALVGASLGDDPIVRARSIGYPMGVGSYSLGSWGIVKIEADNPTDNAVVIPCEAWFESNRSLHSLRKVWLPPHSRRTTWMPVYLPQKL